MRVPGPKGFAFSVSLLWMVAASAPVTAQDCNQNGVSDATDIATGTSEDCNGNGRPDECDVAPTFDLGPSSELFVGSAPAGVTIADLGGDSSLDLAVVDLFSADVAIFLNDGTGNLELVAFPSVDLFPAAIAHGDFNRDELIDLVVATVEGVSVLMNQGAGTFAPAERFPAGTEPIAIAVGDLNGDGKLDLVVVNNSPQEADPSDISILLGDGEGAFAAPDTLVVGASPTFVALADFDGDGTLDLAVTDAESPNISILFNTGDATFNGPAVFPAGPDGESPAQVAAADLNGDDHIDLAVTNPIDGSVSVLLNDGNGVFPSRTSYDARLVPQAVDVGDLDGDGDLDLAVANFGSSDVTVLLNRGDGSFVSAGPFPVIDGPLDLAIGDFDNDGLPDLAVPNLGQFEPEFLPGFEVSLLMNTTTPPESEDRNHDNVPDECGPALITLMNGLGGADQFIWPLADNVPFTDFVFHATEALILDDVVAMYTGVGPVPQVQFQDRSEGLHRVLLSPAPAPGEWLKLRFTVTGRTSNVTAILDMWVAHHPNDIDQSGGVNIKDATAFGIEFRDPRRAFALVDLNGDGSIDVRDATVFGNQWRGNAPALQVWANHVLPTRPD